MEEHVPILSFVPPAEYYEVLNIDAQLMFFFTDSAIHVPNEIGSIVHVQKISEASAKNGVLLRHEISGLSQQLLVLKTADYAENAMEKARELFSEEMLLATIIRDVYKVCATKKIGDLSIPLRQKIQRMVLNPSSEDQDSPYFVRTMLKQNSTHCIDENDLSELLEFSFNRRRLKQDCRNLIRQRALEFWKTGRLEPIKT